MYWELDPCALHCQFSIKYLYTNCKQFAHILLWLTKKLRFVLSLCAAISKMQPFLLEVDLLCTTTNLTVDTRANEIKP